MVPEAITNLSQLPLFIVLLLILSYFIWSKFLREKNKLNIRDVNDILDIISIFFFLSISFIGVIISLDILSSITNLNLNLTAILSKLPSIMLFLSVIILLFLIGYRNSKETNKEDLKIFFLIIGTSSGVLLLVNFALLLLTKFFSYRVFFKPQFALIILLALFMITIWGVTIRGLFNKNMKNFFNKRFIITILISIILIIVISLLATTTINQKKFEPISYKIYDTNKKEGYLFGKIPIIIHELGDDSLIHIISANFGKEGIITEGVGSNNFRIYFNNSEKELSLMNTYGTSHSQSIKGISKIEIVDKTIGIIYEPSIFKEQKFKTMFLYGITNKSINISDKFHYEDDSNYRESCFGNGCVFEIKMINKINDLPLSFENDLFENLNNRNVTSPNNCKLKELNLKYNYVNSSIREEYVICESDGHACDTDLRVQRDSEWVRTFSLHFDINNGAIYRQVHFKEPMNVNATLTLEC